MLGGASSSAVQNESVGISQIKGLYPGERAENREYIIPNEGDQRVALIIQRIMDVLKPLEFGLAHVELPQFNSSDFDSQVCEAEPESKKYQLLLRQYWTIREALEELIRVDFELIRKLKNIQSGVDLSQTNIPESFNSQSNFFQSNSFSWVSYHLLRLVQA